VKGKFRIFFFVKKGRKKRKKRKEERIEKEREIG
jgi:hypothetical protein